MKLLLNAYLDSELSKDINLAIVVTLIGGSVIHWIAG